MWHDLWKWGWFPLTHLLWWLLVIGALDLALRRLARREHAESRRYPS